MKPLRTVLTAIAVLLPRPWLWVTAVRQIVRFSPDGWWKRPPFLPVPDRALLEFRGTTQYGDPDHPVDGGHLADF